MRKFAVSLLLLIAAIGGVGAAIAIADGPSTGTNTACATVSVPDHTVGVDGQPVDTITGTTTSSCTTQTYTIPTSTTTVTVTATPTTSTSTTTPTTTSTSTSSTTSTTQTNPNPPPNQWTVNCPLTHAGSGCWAANTGVFGATGFSEAQIEANPATAGFTEHQGDLVIRQSNDVVDHEWIVGCVQIADGANNVTIKDSLITPEGSNCSGDDAGGSAINTGQGSSIGHGTLIEDTTVDGGTQCNGCNGAGITLDGGEALRVNIFGFTRALLSDSNSAQYPAVFQDDYAHGFSGCVHDDGTWFDSSSYVTLEHSYVLMGDVYGGGCTTAALSGGADYGPQDHVTYDSNYGDGADGENLHLGCGSTQMTITNNALDNGAAKDASDGGYQSLTGNTWSGNYSVDDSTGANEGSWGPFSAGC